MAKFPTFMSTLPFKLLILNLLTPISTLSLVIPTTATTNNPNFDAQISLLGDAKISDDGSHVQLTSPFPSSSGLLAYNNPFKLLSSNSDKTTSFSTEFSFSLTGNANGLSLLMGTHSFASKIVDQGRFGFLSEKRYLGIVEFGMSKGTNVGDFNASLVAGSVSNVSPVQLVINSGEKLKSWVDYDATSKRVEMRLSKLGDKRPYNPITAYSMDLSKMWEDNEVYAALGSFNGKSLETCSVYSWRFRLRKVPNWMHSLPADPHGYTDKSNEDFRAHKRSFCPLSILAGVIFATGCGALLAFAMMFVWAVLMNRHTVFPIKGTDQPLDFRYGKISVVVEKDGEVVKN